MDDVFAWVNGALAALASLSAFGALNKMSLGRTRPCVALAMFLICIGALGSLLGVVKGEWAVYLDTALLGGIAALILATQKVPSWVGERYANPLASIVAGIAAVLLIAALFMGGAVT